MGLVGLDEIKGGKVVKGAGGKGRG